MAFASFRPPAPGVYRPERRSFERAVKEGNSVLEAQVRVDSAIEVQLDQYRRDRDIDSPRFEAPLRTMQSYLDETVASLSPESRSGSWNDYFRLKLRRDTLPVSFYAPMAFDDHTNPRHQEIRSQLVDGLYGQITARLDEALALYDTGAVRNFEPDDYREIRGVINELSALALLNKNQSSDQIAISSSIIADLRRQTDTVLYHTQGEYSIATPIQVKSNPPDVDYIRLPEDGFFIIAAHMDNQPKSGNPNSFRGARLLVKDAAGTINTDERRHFDYIYTSFRRYIDGELDSLHQRDQALY